MVDKSGGGAVVVVVDLNVGLVVVVLGSGDV